MVAASSLLPTPHPPPPPLFYHHHPVSLVGCINPLPPPLISPPPPPPLPTTPVSLGSCGSPPSLDPQSPLRHYHHHHHPVSMEGCSGQAYTYFPPPPPPLLIPIPPPHHPLPWSPQMVAEAPLLSTPNHPFTTTTTTILSPWRFAAARHTYFPPTSPSPPPSPLHPLPRPRPPPHAHHPVSTATGRLHPPPLLPPRVPILPPLPRHLSSFWVSRANTFTNSYATTRRTKGWTDGLAD